MIPPESVRPSPLPRDGAPFCRRCDSTRWVCEDHPYLPWAEFAATKDACGCSAGAPCPDCQPSRWTRWAIARPLPANLDRPVELDPGPARLVTVVAGAVLLWQLLRLVEWCWRRWTP